MSARSLDVEVKDGRVRPRYLGARDRPWVQAVLSAVDRQEGRRAERAHRAIRGAAGGIGRHYEVAPAAVSLLLAVEKERWSSRVAADVSPTLAREIVFELASRLPREEALRRAAETLGIQAPAAVEEALFADHPTRQLFVAPFSEPSVDDAIARYNQALVLALIARSSVITAPAPDPIALSSTAKRLGLLCAFTSESRIQLAGPLAIESQRSTYARSLARFLPRLGPLSARVHLDGTVAELDVASVRGPIEKRRWEIAKALGAALVGTAYRAEPAEMTVSIGAHLLVPDAKLVSLLGAVLVDLRPRHTEAGLLRARAIARAAPVPIIVEPWRGLSAGAALSPSICAGVPVLSVDAKRLVRAADEAVSASHAARPRPDPAS